MPHVIWSDEALRDLQRLHDYLFPISPAAARRALQVIEEGIEALRAQPESGRRAGTVQREWKFRYGKGAYLVRYAYNHPVVTIAAVQHSREQRLPPPL